MAFPKLPVCLDCLFAECIIPDQRRARASKERHGFIDPTCVAATFDNRFPNVSSQLPSSQLPSEGFPLKAGGFCFKLTPREVQSLLFFLFLL